MSQITFVVVSIIWLFPVIYNWNILYPGSRTMEKIKIMNKLGSTIDCLSKWGVSLDGHRLTLAVELNKFKKGKTIKSPNINYNPRYNCPAEENWRYQDRLTQP